MAISKEDILEAVSSMSVLDLSDLIKEMEEKFGVSAAAAAVAESAYRRPPRVALRPRTDSDPGRPLADRAGGRRPAFPARHLAAQRLLPPPDADLSGLVAEPG